MKQVNLTITFDEEKLSALKRYMSKKELDLDREMTDASMPCTSWTAGSASVFRTSALPCTSP